MAKPPNRPELYQATRLDVTPGTPYRRRADDHRAVIVHSAVHPVLKQEYVVYQAGPERTWCVASLALFQSRYEKVTQEEPPCPTANTTSCEPTPTPT